VVLRDSVVDSHGYISILCLGLSLIHSSITHLSGILGDIVTFCLCHSVVLLSEDGLGDIVSLCVIVGVGDSLGDGVALLISFGLIHSCGLSEVLFSCVVAITGLRHVLRNSHHLGISEDLGLGEDFWFSISSHSGGEDNCVGSNHSLSDRGPDGSWVFFSDSGVVHAGSLHILSHGLGDNLWVALWRSLRWWTIG